MLSLSRDTVLTWQVFYVTDLVREFALLSDTKEEKATHPGDDDNTAIFGHGKNASNGDDLGPS